MLVKLLILYFSFKKRSYRNNESGVPSENEGLLNVLRGDRRSYLVNELGSYFYIFPLCRCRFSHNIIFRIKSRCSTRVRDSGEAANEAIQRLERGVRGGEAEWPNL